MTSELFVASTADAPAVDGERLYFAFVGDDLVLTNDRLPASLDGLSPEQSHYIGTVNGIHAFSARLSKSVVLGEGFRAEGLRGAVALLDPAQWSAAAYASQIAYWDRTSRFCGECGGATVKVPNERAMRCPRCEHRFYPRISPCTITLVHDDRRILMTRQAKWPAGRYGLVAGFVEPGESLEECAQREILEETAVRVTDVRYAGSQPWPFPGQMMVGFRAKYAGGEVTPCETELEDARWFALDALPILPPKFSIARRLIDDYAREMR